LAIGLALAAVAALLLFGVLFSELAERRGKRNVATGPTVLDLPPVDGASDAPVALAPESVVLPPPSAITEPIVPLDPSPPPSSKRKR
jgi:hypothetical protein